jgi:hypothetical protein
VLHRLRVLLHQGPGINLVNFVRFVSFSTLVSAQNW